MEVPMPPTSGPEAVQADLPTEANQPAPMAVDRALGSRAGLAVAAIVGLGLFAGLTPLLFWTEAQRRPPIPTNAVPTVDTNAAVPGIGRAKQKLVENGYRLPPERK